MKLRNVHLKVDGGKWLSNSAPGNWSAERPPAMTLEEANELLDNTGLVEGLMMIFDEGKLSEIVEDV